MLRDAGSAFIFFLLIRGGERIQITLKAGHHLNGVWLAGQ